MRSDFGRPQATGGQQEEKMSAEKIVRFHPNGLKNNDLQDWDPIDPADLEAGTPIQRGHIYHEDPANGYMVGVWDCTAMTEKFGPYSVNEFMLLLEGSVTIVHANGREVTVDAGESFIIPKGLPCQWRQEGYVRKYFVIFENPGGYAAADVATQSIIVPECSAPPEGMQRIDADGTFEFIGDAPTQHSQLCFADPSDQFSCSLWDSSPFETPVTPFPRNEFFTLIEGSMILTDEKGNEHLFKTGETAYVPKGVSCGRKSADHVRALRCLFSPA